MSQLVGLTRGDEAAKAGLQRAVVDHILRDLTSTVRGAGADATALKPDGFQRLLRRSEPALGELFSPQQVESIQRIAADLQRMNLDTRAPGGGSDTAQNLAAQQKVGERIGSIIDRARQMAPGFGASGLGFLFYGWEAATAAAVAAVVHGARQAGLRTVDDLVVRAMLDPEVARLLYANATPRSVDGILSKLGDRLARSARIGAEVGSSEDGPRRQPAPPASIGRRNTLLETGRLPGTAGARGEGTNRLLALAG